ncbi:MAG: hypothetical protein H0U21_11885, partial [Acidimicrobiia bacterium]|nr:hypothetical protein [Acidimicrobiia bacterium]
LLAVGLQADDPDRLAARWSAILDRAATVVDGAVTIALDRGTVRFRAAADGRGDGLAAIDLGVGSGAGEAISIGGVRITLVPPPAAAAPHRPGRRS